MDFVHESKLVPNGRKQMKYKTSGAFLVALFFFVLSVSHAGARETAAQFLNLEKDARAAAMGDAFTTVSGDVGAIFYNPGGLAFMEGGQLTWAYTDLKAALGKSYAFSLAGGAPLYLGSSRSFKGILAAGLQIENQGSTLVNAAEEEIGKNWAFTMSYANHSPKLAGGLSFKLIHEKLLDESDTSMALDMGLQYDLIKKFIVERDLSKVNDPNFGLKAGIALQNLGMGIKLLDEELSLPRQLSFGVSTDACLRLRDIFPDSNTPVGLAIFRFRLSLELTAFVDKLKKSDADLEKPEFDEKKAGVGINALRSGNMEKNMGTEVWLFDVLALRAGYISRPDMSEDLEFGDKLVYGLGLRFPISHLVGFSDTPGLKQFDQFYRETDRQIFVEFDLSVNPGTDVPGADRSKTITFKIGI